MKCIFLFYLNKNITIRKGKYFKNILFKISVIFNIIPVIEFIKML